VNYVANFISQIKFELRQMQFVECTSKVYAKKTVIPIKFVLK
jgi:hypothetical protein